MTPTLFGRWQTRLLLFSTIGVLVTLPFFLGLITSQSGSIFIYFDPAVPLGSRLARRVSITRWDLGGAFCVIFNQNYRFARDTDTRF